MILIKLILITVKNLKTLREFKKLVDKTYSTKLNQNKLFFKVFQLYLARRIQETRISRTLSYFELDNIRCEFDFKIFLRTSATSPDRGVTDMLKSNKKAEFCVT